MKIKYFRSLFLVKIGTETKEVGALHLEGEDYMLEQQKILADSYGMKNVKYLRTEFYKEVEVS